MAIRVGGGAEEPVTGRAGAELAEPLGDAEVAGGLDGAGLLYGGGDDGPGLGDEGGAEDGGLDGQRGQPCGGFWPFGTAGSYTQCHTAQGSPVRCSHRYVRGPLRVLMVSSSPTFQPVQAAPARGDGWWLSSSPAAAAAAGSARLSRTPRLASRIWIRLVTRGAYRDKTPADHRNATDRTSSGGRTNGDTVT